MAHKTVTKWKGGMLFESDNPSGNTYKKRSGNGVGGTFALSFDGERTRSLPSDATPVLVKESLLGLKTVQSLISSIRF